MTGMQVGIPGCDVDVACQVAGYGFGENLLQATTTLPFLEFMKYMPKWRSDLCDVLFHFFIVVLCPLHIVIWLCSFVWNSEQLLNTLHLTIW